MPRYNYVALDAQGQEISGVLDAMSQNDAISQLRQSGYFPKEIVEEGKGRAPKAKKTAAVVAAPKAEKRSMDISIPFLQRKTIKGKTTRI